MLLDQGGGEAVVPGGDGGVRREDGHLRDVADRLAERRRVGLHHRADHLQPREGAMPLVQVEHRGRDPQGVQDADAADAQEQFLADPDARVAAVEPRRQRAVARGVLRHVGIQQQQGRPPHLDPPDPRPEHAQVRVDRHHQRLAVRPEHLLDRQQVGVGVEVVFLLPAVGVERLAEVALVVEQADADQGDAQVAGALQVVAGQDPEAPRVDRQALVQPELGREVRDRPRPEARGVDGAPGVVALEVLGQPPEGIVDPRVERHLGRTPLELLGRDPLEEVDRVVVGHAPERGIELAEQADDLRLPGPPEVPRQLSELINQL